MSAEDAQYCIMGLGKTAQTLAHIAVERAAGRLHRPALGVVPTSLVANWIAEAAKFTPDFGARPMAWARPPRWARGGRRRRSRCHDLHGAGERHRDHVRPRVASRRP